MSLLLFFNNGVAISGGFFTLTSQLGIANSMLGNTLLGYYSLQTSFASTFDLYIRGDTPPANSSNDLTLTLVGHSGINNNFTLFTEGCVPVNSGLPLFMDGAWPTGSVPLFIYGLSSSTQNIPLVLRGNELSYSNNNFNLFIFGSSPGTSGYTAGMPLFLEAISGNRVNNNIPLFVSGPGIGSGNKNINLFIGGYYQSASENITLFLQNLFGVGSIPLYIRGSGVTSGALPYNGSLDLYIHRTNATNIIPLYLRGPGDPAISSTPLYIYGNSSISSGVNLVVPYVYEVKNNISIPVKLYTHGF